MSIDEQKELLRESIIGRKSEKTQRSQDLAKDTFIMVSVISYLNILKKINKFDEWIRRSVNFKVFRTLPVKEKIKYHNELVKFHDDCMTKIKGAPPSKKRVLASSPTVDVGAPDFNDGKWEEVK